MWAAICRQWDYFALTFLVGVYLTAGLALAVTLLLMVRATF